MTLVKKYIKETILRQEGDWWIVEDVITWDSGKVQTIKRLETDVQESAEKAFKDLVDFYKEQERKRSNA